MSWLAVSLVPFSFVQVVDPPPETEATVIPAPAEVILTPRTQTSPTDAAVSPLSVVPPVVSALIKLAAFVVMVGVAAEAGPAPSAPSTVNRPDAKVTEQVSAIALVTDSRP
jgi:hypothetical protein